ncbi:GNAT family N-acetyltransferase [Arenibaculum pallidiluteum]|uniref:GNAT family N-acetyltransferase n=1 Tax=Arenibaculum pallidiluteum TaxID=2812559 RepID=UPI001A96F8A8|nr:GNAT family N-acetyltransferase [Arenibaculum pallidiluteum]
MTPMPVDTRRDAAAVAAHLLRLSPAARLSRWHGMLSDLAVNAYAQSLARRKSRVRLLAFRDEAGEIRGLAELVLRPEHDEAELALTVEDAWQGAGRGRQLGRAAIAAAEQLGVRCITMQIMPDNAPMLRIARGCGAAISTAEGGDVALARKTCRAG